MNISDKPDTRFGLEMQDVTSVFADTAFAPFKATIEAGGTIRALNARGLADKLTRKTIDKLTAAAEQNKDEIAKLYAENRLNEALKYF